ncbi:MAG TPA: hypothetical protein VK253_08265 [Candidatus Binatia bacterium]|nr:hypothetical protein [Candidatus Binatia bacterium]
MSVFVFDQDTIGMIRYILALQRFKEYSVGPQGLNEYLCAVSFNRVLIQTGLKFPKFQKEDPGDIRVCEVIRFLEQKSHISPTTAKKLREYVDFQVSLIQSSAQTAPKKPNPKAQEILLFLCTEAGLDQDKELKNRIFEDIATLATRQSASNENYEKLIESDFDNFDKLYVKCPALQLEIQKGLTIPLRSAQISGFTPYTGGLWMPFVTLATPDNRALFEVASVGVAFTPVDIRIGLDFGSQAHKYRIRYYEMLLNGELMDEFESLNRKDAGYCLCDTFWHYHIRNIQSLQWCLTLYHSTKITIERVIEETRQLQGTQLTANKYLISKVIKRRPEDFGYRIDGIVDEISKTLNELYPTIEFIEA